MKTLEIALFIQNTDFMKSFIRSLQYTFQRYGVQPIISTFQDSRILEEKLKGIRFCDILVLDMDTGNAGQRLAELSNQQLPQPLLIFLSSSEKFIYQMIRLQPFRILRKGAFGKELNECIQTLLREMPGRVTYPCLILDSGNSLYRININHIRYVESNDKHLDIIMTDRKVTLRYSLNDMEDHLAGYHFLRIHKSYLVNAQCIFRIDAKEVVLDDGRSLPLSRYRAEETRCQFRDMFLWSTV